jgi:hypothetical protein
VSFDKKNNQLEEELAALTLRVRELETLLGEQIRRLELIEGLALVLTAIREIHNDLINELGARVKSTKDWGKTIALSHRPDSTP